MLQPYVRHPTPLFKVFVMGPLTVVARRPSLRVPPPPGDVTVEQRRGALDREGERVRVRRGRGRGGRRRRRGRRSRSGCRCGGDGATEGAPAAASPSPPEALFEAPDPPQWALEALAAHLRASLGLNLFNFDLITVDKTRAPPAAAAAENGGGGGGNGGGSANGDSPSSAAAAPPAADYLVIDINYFPGFEKLPDYEGLLIEFLAWLFRPTTAGRICGAPERQRRGEPGTQSEEAGAPTAAAALRMPPHLAMLLLLILLPLLLLPPPRRRTSSPSCASGRGRGQQPPRPLPHLPLPPPPPPPRPLSPHSLPSSASTRPLPDALATASSAGSSPLRGADSAASLQKLARSLSQRPV